MGLTDRAVIFEPHRFDKLVGGRSRRIPLAQISDVGIQPAGARASLFGGGLRKRLRLTLVDGRIELLLINRVEERVQQVAEAVQRAQ